VESTDTLLIVWALINHTNDNVSIDHGIKIHLDTNSSEYIHDWYRITKSTDERSIIAEVMEYTSAQQ
jgi:hypothetical protein